jgi:hypothetical protein
MPVRVDGGFGLAWVSLGAPSKLMWLTFAWPRSPQTWHVQAVVR